MTQINFKSKFVARAERYFSWIAIFCFFFVIFSTVYPILLGKESMFILLFKKIFLSDIRLALLFGIMPVLLQVFGYYSTQKKTNLLELLEDKLVFTFFNNKILELKYSDLSSLELTKDKYKNFEFTLKNGEKKIVYATVKDKMKAFELINQKIKK